MLTCHICRIYIHTSTVTIFSVYLPHIQNIYPHLHSIYLVFTCHINRESIQYQHHHSNYSVFTYHIYRISIHASTVTIQCLPATYTEFLSTPPQLLFSVNLPHIQNIYPHLHSNYSVFTCHIYRISIYTSNI